MWGPDEQSIGANINNSADFRHFSPSYPLTINLIFNHKTLVYTTAQEQ